MRKLFEKHKIAIILSVFLLFSQAMVAAEDNAYLQVPALIQVSSTVSEGRYKLSEILNIARSEGFKTVIFTDRDAMRWEYGIWPLRNLIKKTIENSSIATFGIKKYLEEIRQLQRRNYDLVLVPGIETAPFYYWSGNVWKRHLILHDWHKHMLVFGLDKEEDIANMPVVANRRALYLPYQAKDILRFWPFLLFLVGFSYARGEKYKVKDKIIKFSAPLKRVSGITLMIFGGLFIVNDFPYRQVIYDQYMTDARVLPYQKVIDYVNKKNGLVFWAHPEATNYSKTPYVEIVTKEHAGDFLETRDYCGFSIFYEGYNKIGKPGGLWDEVLLEYVRGKRSKPIWAIAGMAFDYYGDLAVQSRDLKNVLLVKELNEQGVLEALKNGRLYVMRGLNSGAFVLDKFVVQDSVSGRSRNIGETLSLKDSMPVIELKGHFKDTTDTEIEVKIIRDKEIIKTLKLKTPLDLRYEDNTFKGNTKSYYRIEIKAKGLHLVTNPIFIIKNSY